MQLAIPCVPSMVPLNMVQGNATEHHAEGLLKQGSTKMDPGYLETNVKGNEIKLW